MLFFQVALNVFVRVDLDVFIRLVVADNRRRSGETISSWRGQVFGENISYLGLFFLFLATGTLLSVKSGFLTCLMTERADLG